MFRFEQADILYFLIAIPVGIVLFLMAIHFKGLSIQRAGASDVIQRLFPAWSLLREWIKVSFILAGLAFMLVAWANPQWGARKQRVKAKSADVIIALDISQSMMAEDVSPNRMERSKRFVTQLIKSLRGERIGLIFFAGGAYLQMPLSNDYASAELFIKSASPRQAGTQGTVIADAIALSQSVFGAGEKKQRALILISDGENHESEAIQAARSAKDNGTFVFTLGVGTEEGAMVPFLNRGRKEYKRDASGQAIKSSLNVGLLKDVAQAGGGSFYMIDQTFSAIGKIQTEISRIEKQEVEQRSFTDYESYFQYFLFAGVLFFIAEFFISNQRRRRFSIRKVLGI